MMSDADEWAKRVNAAAAPRRSGDVISGSVYATRDASVIGEAEGYAREGWGSVRAVTSKVTGVGVPMSSIPREDRHLYEVAIKPGYKDRNSTVYLTKIPTAAATRETAKPVHAARGPVADTDDARLVDAAAAKCGGDLNKLGKKVDSNGANLTNIRDRGEGYMRAEVREKLRKIAEG
jgi:hypothetical protein